MLGIVILELIKILVAILKLILFEDGSQSKIDIPDGKATFVSVNDKNHIVVMVYKDNSNILLIAENKNFKIISNDALDASVTNDTLYYMENDCVYSISLNNSKANPKLFFKGTFAIAHYNNEAQGAIVPNDKSNYTAYGYNIYK